MTRPLARHGCARDALPHPHPVCLAFSQCLPRIRSEEFRADAGLRDSCMSRDARSQICVCLRLPSRHSHFTSLISLSAKPRFVARAHPHVHRTAIDCRHRPGPFSYLLLRLAIDVRRRLPHSRYTHLPRTVRTLPISNVRVNGGKRKASRGQFCARASHPINLLSMSQSGSIFPAGYGIIWKRSKSTLTRGRRLQRDECTNSASVRSQRVSRNDGGRV